MRTFIELHVNLKGLKILSWFFFQVNNNITNNATGVAFFLIIRRNKYHEYRDN